MDDIFHMIPKRVMGWKLYTPNSANMLTEIWP